MGKVFMSIPRNFANRNAVSVFDEQVENNSILLFLFMQICICSLTPIGQSTEKKYSSPSLTDAPIKEFGNSIIIDCIDDIIHK